MSQHSTGMPLGKANKIETLKDCWKAALLVQTVYSIFGAAIVKPVTLLVCVTLSRRQPQVCCPLLQIKRNEDFPRTS